MERDCYRIEVLYYLNPHLIWVEVVETSQQDFVFEQIGLYGVLPFETTIDGQGDGLKAQRCEDWVAASSVLMKKSFLEAKEVWFRPTYIDRRTSIFDDNIHKYGEIIIKTQDNKQYELSKTLMNSGFALCDICLFHQELGLGNLKTKLNHAKTLDIIKHLEKDTRSSSKKHRRSSVKKQTTVFHAANELGSTLTETNLRRHENFISSNIDMMLEKKSKDFDRCKDIDDEALGRASRLKRINSEVTSQSGSVVQEPPRIPLLLKKKLELNKRQISNKNDPLQVLLATKEYLEANARVIVNKSDTSENTEPNYQEGKKYIDSNKLDKSETSSYHDVKPITKSIDVSPQTTDNLLYTNQVIDKKMDFATKSMDFATKSMDLNKSKSDDSFVDVAMNDIKPKRNPNRRPKKPKTKIPAYNMATEKRVAYGPPGIDSSTLHLKVVPKQADEEDVMVSRKDDDKEPSKSQEMYANVDSNVDLEITNKDVLNEKFNNLNSSIDASNLNDTINVSSQIDNSKNDSLDSIKTEESLPSTRYSTTKFAVMQKKLKLLNKSGSSITSNSDTTNKDSSSDDVKPKMLKRTHKPVLDSDDNDDISDLIEKISIEYQPKSIKSETERRRKVKVTQIDVKNNVNPFKNIDSSLSMFVDKIVTPVLMVHNKMNYPIEPSSNIRDVNFNTHIHVVLKNVGVDRPMMLQMVSWPVILRGYSLFMIGPLGSGKTFGYLPAVCRLITDDCGSEFIDSVGPTCIIVCATAQSVSEVEHYAKMFLGVAEKVVSCFAGVDELELTTSLLNGCNLFICTPSVLVRLLQLTDFGLDLRRLSTFVLEDCERLSEVYSSEIKYSLIKIREMLKNRVNKELKVQFVVASRVWCDFLEQLAKKTPNSVVCIGAFQECVLYSKANTTVVFLKKDNKINKVLEFLKEVDGTKRTVIVCRANEEVEEVLKVLMKHKYAVFACNDTMTVEELYSLCQSWQEYQEPVLAPILLCCDGNLNHLNVTDAHNLLHYSLPQLFSTFCKRFSVLNDNYASIFREKNEKVKIKVFLEDSNTEQLPKILHFIKRCTDHVPKLFDEVCEAVLKEKDMMKANKFVSICDSTLAFGECQDFWNCQERHAVFKEYDEPKDWMPRNGVITFKILHYHTAVKYSVRLLSHTANGKTRKFPQAYSTLSLKMGMYFSKESNKKLQGIPDVGDVCAVSIKQNFFVRCQVLKILTRYNNGTPNCVLIKLIDEEKLEKSRDIYLYHLPEELKKIESHIVHVRLANICPRDKDITFSRLALDMLKKITANDDDLYVRGQVALTLGNCIMVDTLEACQELTSLNETVVMHNLKKELLNTHAIANKEHMVKLEKLCGHIIVNETEKSVKIPTPTKLQKETLKPQWAHLEQGEMLPVYFASAESPGMFFIRLAKFESCMNLLLKDIAKYIDGEPKSLERVTIGDIVLAKFPDDATFERARIDDIPSENIVKCFFVDQGDWRDVQMKDLVKMPSRFVSQIPFQAIECRLIGVQPAGDYWTEFGTNWFYDNCFDSNGDPKMLYVQYFTKEDSTHTDGRKYGVVVIDTSSDHDVVINQLMIDLNLAQEIEDEVMHLQNLDIINPKDLDDKISEDHCSEEGELDDLPEPSVPMQSNSLVPVNSIQEETPEPTLDNIFLKQPIRSVPLVDSDNESTDSWDIVNPKDLVAILKGVKSVNVDQRSTSTLNSNINQSDAGESKNSQHSESVKETISKELNSDTSEANTDNLVLNKAQMPEEVIKNTNKVIFLDKMKENAKTGTSPLDSDDLSSTDSSQLSEQSLKQAKILPEETIKRLDLDKIEELRRPKLLWRQNKTSVSIKIQLIGSQSYNVKLVERSIMFDAICNELKYGFEFDLYGVVDDLVHSDKGQYILVKLNKVLKKNWLSLTKDGGVRKWVVYDVDSIDTSSEEEDHVPNVLADVVKELQENEGDTDSDDDFLDDINYEYKRDI